MILCSLLLLWFLQKQIGGIILGATFAYMTQENSCSVNRAHASQKAGHPWITLHVCSILLPQLISVNTYEQKYKGNKTSLMQ